MNWSTSAWKNVETIYADILRHPFVCQLADGSLSRQRFEFYISQDALYIDNYSRVLAHIASRIPSKSHSEDFLRFALDGVMVEKALHRSFLGDSPVAADPSPACMLYMAFESSKAIEPVEVEAAAILPCFWVYQRVGEEILRRSAPDNPYRLWIETYADKAFALSTLKAIEICDSLAAGAPQHILDSMTRAFVYATRMEWMFWDSAFNMQQWKI